VVRMVNDTFGIEKSTAFCMPPIDVSEVDLTGVTGSPKICQEICGEIRHSERDATGLLGYCKGLPAPVDVERSLISRILDVKAGIVLGPTFARLIVWCDHDWGCPRREGI